MEPGNPSSRRWLPKKSSIRPPPLAPSSSASSTSHIGLLLNSDSETQTESSAENQDRNGSSLKPTHHPIVIRGGFGPLAEEIVQKVYTNQRAYPPPSNTMYTLDTHARDPNVLKKRQSKMETWSNTGLGPTIRNSSLEAQQHDGQNENDDRLDLDSEAEEAALNSSKGDKVAETIDFARPTWVTRIPSMSGADIFYPPKEQRRDLVTAIDSGAAQFEFCYKCKRRHIPPGSPLTLQDRDTCASLLPEWFPSSFFEKPWDEFIAMVNQLVQFNEDLDYHNSKKNPDYVWDLNFHDYDNKWKAAGRQWGGWWKCRSGPNAPEPERMCRQCHGKSSDEKPARAPPMDRKTILKKKKSLETYIDAYIKKAGLRDRAIVEARIRAEGWPEHLGGTYKANTDELRTNFGVGSLD